MKFSKEDKFLVKIYFKSGNVHEGWYTKLKAKYEGDKLTHVEWKGLKGTQNIFWALSEVEFIQVIQIKRSVWNLFKKAN